MTRVTMDTPFAMVPEWVIKSDISAHAVRLYAAIFRFANLPHGAMPGRQALAGEWLHVSLDTLDRAQAELVDIGALTKSSRPGKPNEYILHASPKRGRARAAVKDTNSRTGAVMDSRTRAARKKVDSREDLHGPPAAAVARERVRTPRDELWDAISEVTETTPETHGERSFFGKSVKEILEAGGTPEEVKYRARRYMMKYPGAVLTHRALAMHWGELAGKKPRAANVDCPKCGDKLENQRKLTEHLYDKHDTGKLCPDCATVIGENEGHKCSLSK